MQNKPAIIIGNPVQNKLAVIISNTVNNSMSEWEIISVAGQVIHKGKNTAGRIEVNVSALAAGQYWFRVRSNKEWQTLPFIKQ
ncbi:MAG: T9SS type A sorting domain-containing protein [Bacteroidota bacterium]